MVKRLKIISVFFAAVLLVYTVAGFLVLPPVLKSVLTKQLTQTLHRNVSIQKIRTNPYLLTAEIRGLSIQDRTQSQVFVSVADILIDVEWVSLFKLAPIIRELKIERPFIKLVRLDEHTYNFSDLIKGEKKPQAKGARPLEFSLANIQLSGGRVDFDDRPLHKVHSARDITVAIPFISNIPTYVDVFVQPRFQAVINRTPVALVGRTKPFKDSLETTFNLRLKDIDLPYYLAYVPMQRGLTVDAGLLDINAELAYKQFHDKRQPSLDVSGELSGRDIDIKGLDGRPVLLVPKVSVELGPSRILRKQIHVSKVLISSPVLHVNRDKNGRLNLAALRQPKSAPEKEEAPSNPLTLNIDAVELTGGGLAYSDFSGNSPVTLTASALSISARSISTTGKGGGTVKLSATLNRLAHLTLGSAFTLKPFETRTTLSLEGFQPAWIQPYVIERFPILIRRGTIDVQGKVDLALNAAKPMEVHFTGDVHSSDFACVDRVYTQDLAAWKELKVSGVDCSLKPLRIMIREIGLTSPAVTFIILPDGQSIMAALTAEQPSQTKPETTGEKTGKQEPRPHIAIGRVMLKNGRFTFRDRSVSPVYSTQVTGISGSIAGLSSDEFKKADVNLKARLDNQSPITLTGAVNPLKQDLYVDLVARLSNIELSPATPYSGKYLGLALDKGKLSLGLAYQIDQKQLQAQNDVLIDQLTFGEAVQSKDATKLPVKLAVALLRDSSGKIDLKLPVNGRTDDPNFHVGRVIIQMLVNIIKKAATAPFALLEALYPGASELSTIAFEPGKADISPAEEPKIAQLIQILSERPSLKLEISGFVDPDADKQGLRDYLFERMLKQQKLKDILRQGRQAPAVDDIVIAPEENHAYLEKAYRDADFAKPTNALGMLKTIPDKDMRELMLAHLTVTDGDLSDLAEARARGVRDRLVASGKIDPGRIFLVKADPLTPPTDGQTGKARVSLFIK